MTSDMQCHDEKKPYTVLLLRPDYVAQEFGKDTFCAYIYAKDAQDAVDKARKEACLVDLEDEPEDYYCLFCTPGHVINFETR